MKAVLASAAIAISAISLAACSTIHPSPASAPASVTQCPGYNPNAVDDGCSAPSSPAPQPSVRYFTPATIYTVAKQIGIKITEDYGADMAATDSGEGTWHGQRVQIDTFASNDALQEWVTGPGSTVAVLAQGDDWVMYKAIDNAASGSVPAVTTALVASAPTPGQRILAAAKVYVNHWYRYGYDGPVYFDCSGLVYRAALNAGIPGIPRTTGALATSRNFYRVYSPQPGDIAMWGSGSSAYHEEIVTGGNWQTFGARKTGTRVGWHNNTYWRPTEFLRYR